MAKVNLSNASIGDSWVIGIPSMNPSFALFGGFVDFILSGFLDFGKWDLGKPLWRTAFTFVVDCMSELERFCRCVQNLWSVFCFKWDWMMSRPSWNVCISFSVLLKVRLHQQRFWYPFAIGHWVDDWYFIIYKPKRFIFTWIFRGKKGKGFCVKKGFPVEHQKHLYKNCSVFLGLLYCSIIPDLRWQDFFSYRKPFFKNWSFSGSTSFLKCRTFFR